MYNKQNTLIIIDWDDTLFPTSYMKTKIIPDQEHISNMNKLDNLIYLFFSKASYLSTPIIITNASKKWVEESSQLLKKTNFLIKYKIDILSSRDLCEQKYKDKTDIWKKLTFQTLYDKNKHIKNIISIGDAEYEYNALINLYDNKDNNSIKLKAVRLLEEPNIYNIIDQLEVLIKEIQNITYKDDHLDMNFIKK